MNTRKPPRKLSREELQQYGVRLLAGRALSVDELKMRLQRRALSIEDADAVVEALRGYGFLDDERFAEHFANTRRESGTMGSQRVFRDLRKRRVSGTIAQDTVAAAYQGADESELIRAWLERRMRGTDMREHLKEERNLASVYRKLRYAGFSSAAVSRVLSSIASRAVDITEDDEG